MFRWITSLTNKVQEVQRCPRNQSDDSNFHKEQAVDVTSIEVLLKEDDGHEVDDTGEKLD